MEGWISLHRQIMENEFYFAERFNKALAWIDLLLLANHKPAKIFIRGIEVKLKTGDLCYSQLTLAKRWKWNFKTVKKYLDLLTDKGMITYSGGKLTTIISIINYSKYQKNGEQNQSIKSISELDFISGGMENKRENRMENRMETDNNVNNDNNENKGNNNTRNLKKSCEVNISPVFNSVIVNNKKEIIKEDKPVNSKSLGLIEAVFNEKFDSKEYAKKNALN